MCHLEKSNPARSYQDTQLILLLIVRSKNFNFNHITPLLVHKHNSHLLSISEKLKDLAAPMTFNEYISVKDRVI